MGFNNTIIKKNRSSECCIEPSGFMSQGVSDGYIGYFRGDGRAPIMPVIKKLSLKLKSFEVFARLYDSILSIPVFLFS